MYALFSHFVSGYDGAKIVRIGQDFTEFQSAIDRMPLSCTAAKA